jgi:galactokinase/mevalonate kinase-like predicted kinase
VLACFDGLDGLFSMYRGHCGNNNSIESRMFEHLVIVAIDDGAIGGKLLEGPGGLLLIWREGSNEICTGTAFKKVESMASLAGSAC